MMTAAFEILDAQKTSLGELVLRRRRILSLDTEVYEIKLGDAFLMSSLFHDVEVALADLGLAALGQPADPPGGRTHDVVVGGLGLGYTARAALDCPSTGSMLIVEALGEVIDWHRRGLVPLGPGLVADPRCRLVHGDFFALAGERRFDTDQPGRRFDAVLLDIDHSPRNLLAEEHAAFYERPSLQGLADQLHEGGVFAMWSDDPPDKMFLSKLEEVFSAAEAHVVTFNNPLLNEASASTVYVARRGSSKD